MLFEVPFIPNHSVNLRISIWVSAISSHIFYRSGCIYIVKIMLNQPSPTRTLGEAGNWAQSSGFPHSGTGGTGEHKKGSGDITLPNPQLVLAHFPQVGNLSQLSAGFHTCLGYFQYFPPLCSAFLCASSLRSSVKSLPWIRLCFDGKTGVFSAEIGLPSSSIKCGTGDGAGSG